MIVEYGVRPNFIGDELIVEKWDNKTYYPYILVCSTLKDYNGNGTRQIKVYEWSKEPYEIQENFWKIEPVVEVPFDWSGSRLLPNIIDPEGNSRKVSKSGYSLTIFKGLSFERDIVALFQVLKKYSSFKNWHEFDLAEKDSIIAKLKLEIVDLNDKIKTLKGGSIP